MRPTTKIVVFMLFLSGAANMLVASGVAADMGVTPQPGADQKLQEAVEAAGNIDPSNGLGSTLFTMYTSVTSTFEAIFVGLFAGPIMLANIGVPSWVVAFIFGPANILVATDIAYKLMGR